MRNVLLGFFKKPFIKNVLILTSGTIAAQLVTMLFSPIITRLYGPTAYGVMGSFQAVTAILIPIAAFSFPLAIVLPKKINEAKGVVKLSIISTLILSTTLLILLLIFDNWIIEVFQLHNIGSYLYYIPFVTIFAGLVQTMQQWLIRKEKFDISAKANFLQTLITNSGKTGIGFFYPSSGILIFFTAIAQGLRATLMIILSKKDILISSLKSNISLRYTFNKYKDFAYYKSPELLVNGTSGNLPILMLSSFFGPAAAGFYSIGRTVLSMPALLIGKSIGDVFYPRIAQAVNNKEKITQMILKATILLGLIGIIPYGLIILFGPELFSLVFGESWSRAGEYAQWLTLWNFFGFINKPSVMSLPVLSAQRFFFIYSIAMLIIRLSALLLGFILFNNDIIAIALFSISGGILNIILIIITLIFSKRYERTY